MKIVPASRFIVRCLPLLFMVATFACGATASRSKAPGSDHRIEASRGADGQDAAPSIDGIDANPKFDRVRVRLTVPERRGRERLDRAVAVLARSARESGYADLGVLVELAARQIERGSLGSHGSLDKGRSAEGDLESARASLLRVLAIDEHSAPALNQLALLHLAKARTRGRPELELAMGVCIRATREHPTYAPLRNTTGLVEFELRGGAGAVREFQVAVALDPAYSDAQTNLAASLLSTQNFEAAERAYSRLIDLRFDDYEAHLGRALARRGQINDANFRDQVASVESDLERCKELDPERPEAYYNDAILTERFKAVAAPTGKATSVLEQARSLFDTFIAKAGERPEYAREVRLAKQRVRDLGKVFP
jgi:tetratricopeptide (TPR) repeat protein